MRNFPLQVGPGGEPIADSLSWTSSNANDTFQETQNTITDTGQTLIGLASAPDNSQLSQAISRNAAAATFYADSGTTNVYVLSTLGAFKSPTVYLDGQLVRWIAGNANTGASTINVSGVGVKLLTAEGGAALSSGAIDITIENQARFNMANDRFELVRGAGGGAGTVTSVGSGAGLTGGPITTSGTLAVDINSEVDTVITAVDEIMFADTSAGGSIKKDTVQGIINLAGASAASQSEQQAGTNNTVFATPANQQFHRSASSAGAHLTGTGTITLRETFNVSSATDIGVGHYRINYTNNMAGTQYYAAGSSLRGANFTLLVSAEPLATGSYTFQTRRGQDNLVNDSDGVLVVIFGDLL